MKYPVYFQTLKIVDCHSGHVRGNNKVVKVLYDVQKTFSNLFHSRTFLKSEVRQKLMTRATKSAPNNFYECCTKRERDRARLNERPAFLSLTRF